MESSRALLLSILLLLYCVNSVPSCKDNKVECANIESKHYWACLETETNQQTKNKCPDPLKSHPNNQDKSHKSWYCVLSDDKCTAKKVVTVDHVKLVIKKRADAKRKMQNEFDKWEKKNDWAALDADIQAIKTGITKSKTKPKAQSAKTFERVKKHQRTISSSIASLPRFYDDVLDVTFPVSDDSDDSLVADEQKALVKENDFFRKISTELTDVKGMIDALRKDPVIDKLIVHKTKAKSGYYNEYQYEYEGENIDKQYGYYVIIWFGLFILCTCCWLLSFVCGAVGGWIFAQTTHPLNEKMNNYDGRKKEMRDDLI